MSLGQWDRKDNVFVWSDALMWLSWTWRDARAEASAAVVVQDWCALADPNSAPLVAVAAVCMQVDRQGLSCSSQCVWWLETSQVVPWLFDWHNSGSDATFEGDRSIHWCWCVMVISLSNRTPRSRTTSVHWITDEHTIIRQLSQIATWAEQDELSLGGIKLQSKRSVRVCKVSDTGWETG